MAEKEIMIDNITRKTMLYKTGVEYGDYTMNHVLGCSHGCLYPCYAFLMAKRFRKVTGYAQWCKPKLVSNTLEILDAEIPRLKTKIKSVQLCFTTDPFMFGYEEVGQMSMAAINKLNQSGIKCIVLTKGQLPSELAEQSALNEYGISLISIDEGFRKRVEPGAATYESRIATLKDLHDKGFNTWVSIEPYPTPNMIEQSINNILNAVSFVDKVIFGRTNYNKEVTIFPNRKLFYNQQAEMVVDFCVQRGIDYLIKKGTITSVE